MTAPSPENHNIIGAEVMYNNRPVNIVGADYTDVTGGKQGIAILKDAKDGKEYRVPYANAYALVKEWHVPGDGKKVY